MDDEPLELGEGYPRPSPAPAPASTQAPPGGETKPVPFRIPSAPPPRRGGGGLSKLFWVVLLGVGAYGGYFGYCRYKVGELERALSVEMQDFRQKLIRKGGGVTRADVTRVVVEAAGRVGVPVNAAEVQVTFEPLTPENTKQLPSFVQSALGLAAQIPGEKKQLYLVGYRARAFAKHGVAKRWFDSEQFSYLESDWVAP